MLYSTIASWPLLIWKTLDAEGIDPKPVFEQAGIDASLMDKQGHRFSLEHMTKLWKLAADASSHDCFGLEAGKHWHPTTFHALGIAWLSSQTLEDAFSRLARHIAMVSTAATAELIKNSRDYEFRITAKEAATDINAHAIIAGLTSTMIMSRQSSGNALNAGGLTLSFADKGFQAPLTDFFGCDVTFGQDHSGLTLDKETMETPLLSANLELLASTEQIIADYLQRIGKNDLLADIRVEMMRQLPTGNMTDDSIADAMHMSTRTLQRRLAEFGLKYRDLLEKIRLELAERYLNDPNYSITEISFLLGFAETSSFSKSYKKLTGQTPSDVRK